MNGEIHLIATLATENNEPIPLGKPDPLNVVCFLGSLPLLACLSSCPHHTDVSSSLSYRDDNRCDADVSLFDRLHRPRVPCSLSPSFCPHAHCGRWRRSQDFGTYPTRRGRTANTDPKRIFAAPIPPNRIEVAVHKSSENYPPVNMGQDGPHCADSQSQDRSFVLNICNDLANGVKTG